MVNVNSIADIAFDDAASAERWAAHLRSHFKQLDLEDDVRATTVPSTGAERRQAKPLCLTRCACSTGLWTMFLLVDVQ